MNHYCYQFTTSILEINSVSDNDIEQDLKTLSSTPEYVIIDLKNIQDIQGILWFRKLRVKLSLYRKNLIGACNPGIHLEHLKSVSIAIIEFNSSLPVEKNNEINTSMHLPQTIVHYGNLRGGQTINHPYGDVIVVGNLHHGAEIIAGGHIHVFGAINGRALAGTSLGGKAIISAFSLNPELISIDGYYLSSANLSTYNHPVYVVLSGDGLVISD